MNVYFVLQKINLRNRIKCATHIGVSAAWKLANFDLHHFECGAELYFERGTAQSVEIKALESAVSA